jgi:hypothetical protein
MSPVLVKLFFADEAGKACVSTAPFDLKRCGAHREIQNPFFKI